MSSMRAQYIKRVDYMGMDDITGLKFVNEISPTTNLCCMLVADLCHGCALGTFLNSSTPYPVCSNYYPGSSGRWNIGAKISNVTGDCWMPPGESPLGGRVGN
jgi:hypothetical protein